MSFLGPVTLLDGLLVRPHEIEVVTVPFPDAHAGRIIRTSRVGFEVRLEISLTGDEQSTPMLVPSPAPRPPRSSRTRASRSGSRRSPAPPRSSAGLAAANSDERSELAGPQLIIPFQ